MNGDWVNLMEHKDGILWRRLVKWGCRSMHTYRSVTAPNQVVESWPGMASYLSALTGTPLTEARVEKFCWDGDSGRKQIIEELKLQ